MTPVEKEVWKDIPGWDGYKASNLGNLKSFKKSKNGMPLKSLADKDGYLSIVLRCNGKRKFLRVHRLIAFAFIPNPKGLPIINHKDAVKDNNNINNLEWVDQKTNCQHAKNMGLSCIGSRHGNAIFNEFDVLIIRDTFKRKLLNQTEIAKKFNCTSAAISLICKYKAWKHVP